VTLTGVFEGLDDLARASDELARALDPEGEAGGVRATVGAILMSVGFAPDVLDFIDLDGRHVVELRYPIQGELSGPQDVTVAARMALKNVGQFLASIPRSSAPQPLGGGLWELRLDDTTKLLLREQADGIELGLQPADLDRARELPKAVGDGARLRLRADDIPTDEVDVVELFDLPVGEATAQAINGVIRELESVGVGLDFGTRRDLRADAFAVAPFSRLGLGPLGAARTDPTALERALPPRPLALVTMSWGSPELLHRNLDKLVDLASIQTPFDAQLRDMLRQAHATLDAIASDVGLGVYYEPAKGKVGLVLAATVRDAGQARAALRTVMEATAKAFEVYNVLTGKNPDLRWRVSYRPDGLRFTNGGADHLTVGFPPAAKADLKPAEFVLGAKGLDLEIVATDVRGRDGSSVVLLTAGAGARTIAAASHRQATAGGPSAADDIGLARLRAALGGCQICMTVDVVHTAQFSAMVQAIAQDTAMRKRTKAASAQLAKLAPSGAALALGARIEPGRASGAGLLTRELFGASPAFWRALVELSAGDDATALGELVEALPSG
jgi:hypothetical protein